MESLGPPTVGLALIAKNEEERLPTLLASVTGAFDQVVLVDTGSKDKTIEVFERWAKDNDENVVVSHYAWRDDFADARAYADSLLTTNWLVWADCDDEIFNAGVIRQLVNQAPPEVASFICDYDYAQDPQTGVCMCRLKRERIVRRGKGTWTGRVHEAQIIDGPSQFVAPNVVEWRHRKPWEDVDGKHPSNERNLRILRKWNRDDPDNPRILAYLGTESAVQGKHKDAVKWYRRYLNLPAGWPQEYAQVCRKLAVSLIDLGDIDGARQAAFRGMQVDPEWPDSYLTLADVEARNDNPQASLAWANRVIEMGVPNTLLIINPLDYTFGALRWKAGALAAMGRTAEAVDVADEALRIYPDSVFAAGTNEWRAITKRERTAETFAMCAEQLIMHDEQLKALTLLEQCVPHFADAHPKIVSMRSHLRERLAWISNPLDVADHYNDDGSDLEHLVEDPFEWCDHLARAQFLLGNLLEQVEA